MLINANSQMRHCRSSAGQCGRINISVLSLAINISITFISSLDINQRESRLIRFIIMGIHNFVSISQRGYVSL